MFNSQGHGWELFQLTFQGNSQMNRILEFHLLNPHGRIVPLPVVLIHILADASAQLLNNAQRRIVGNFQVCSFPPDRTSECRFERGKNGNAY